MALSQERDALEGELARMPDGAGKTIGAEEEESRRGEEARGGPQAAERHARHQLKSANRAHLVGVGTRR